MRLKEWRLTQSLTLLQCARLFECNSARTYQRYEDGMHRTDAPLVERIAELTGGAVTAQDMHETRLEWLRSKGIVPERAAPVCENAAENVSEETDDHAK